MTGPILKIVAPPSWLNHYNMLLPHCPVSDCFTRNFKLSTPALVRLPTGQRVTFRPNGWGKFRVLTNYQDQTFILTYDNLVHQLMNTLTFLAVHLKFDISNLSLSLQFPPLTGLSFLCLIKTCHGVCLHFSSQGQKDLLNWK